MITETLDDFLSALPAHGGLAGLDLGTKTIGVAVSDATRFIATPLETIARANFTKDSARLMAIIAERRLAGIVLGLPLNMDGSAGPRVQATRAFARNLARLTDIPIGYWDERLSTAAVERMMIAADTSRQKRASVVDQMAAAYILQGMLDWLGTAP
ncbi:MAG: Holliday junction resolvase RuvX [Beijerinckiaceae bacterium]